MNHRKEVLHLKTDHVQAQLNNFGAGVYYGKGRGFPSGAGDQLGKKRRRPSTPQMCKDNIRSHYSDSWPEDWLS